MSGKEISAKKLYFHKDKRMTVIEDGSSYLFLTPVSRINSFSMMKEKLGVKERQVYLSRPGRTQQFEEK